MSTALSRLFSFDVGSGCDMYTHRFYAGFLSEKNKIKTYIYDFFDNVFDIFDNV